MAIPDDFDGHSLGLTSPYVTGADVTPSDSDDLGFLPRALWVGGTGNLAVEFVDGTQVTLDGVPAGTELRLRVAKVLATGTTATAIVALK